MVILANHESAPDYTALSAIIIFALMVFTLAVIALYDIVLALLGLSIHWILVAQLFRLKSASNKDTVDITLKKTEIQYILVAILLLISLNPYSVTFSILEWSVRIEQLSLLQKAEDLMYAMGIELMVVGAIVLAYIHRKELSLTIKEDSVYYQTSNPLFSHSVSISTGGIQTVEFWTKYSSPTASNLMWIVLHSDIGSHFVPITFSNSRRALGKFETRLTVLQSAIETPELFIGYNHGQWYMDFFRKFQADQDLNQSETDFKIEDVAVFKITKNPKIITISILLTAIGFAGIFALGFVPRNLINLTKDPTYYGNHDVAFIMFQVIVLLFGCSWMLYFGVTHLFGMPALEVDEEEIRCVYQLGRLSYTDLVLPLSTVRSIRREKDIVIRTSLYQITL